MHDDRELIEARIARALDERLLRHVYADERPLRVRRWEAPGEPVPFAAVPFDQMRDTRVGEPFGQPWGTTWFELRGEVPDGWDGGAVELVVDLGFHGDSPGFQSEGLVYTEGGRALQGVHPRRTAVPIPAEPGPFLYYVEAASNPPVPGYAPTDVGRLATAGRAPIYHLRRASVARRREGVYQLLLDIEVLDGVMRTLAPNTPRRRRILRALRDALDAFDAELLDARRGDEVGMTVGIAAQRARQVLAPELSRPAHASAHRIVAVGHAHIDTAWLWPMRETRRKCARTFASVLRLMDDDPEFRFACSQAVQYRWIEQDHPDLFERIRGRVADGRWTPVGGMWVEPDMNLPSGESIVRQLVHGQRFFEDRFGVRCREIWIPDVFGYPATLPQIFRAGGCERFVTQKLSWNTKNRFPHSSFRWRGLDGSEVLAHFPPVETYNATISPDELAHASDTFAEHAWSEWSLMPFGYGDGGGGPTREMLERAHRVADLEGAPRVRLGTVGDFFDELEREVHGDDVPVWDGELYFEMHRGTLTSQIATKVANRRVERLLREAELWSAVAGGDTRRFDDAWQTLLTHQFHDILPGSSIGWVHDEAVEALGALQRELEVVVGDTLGTLAAGPAWANAATHERTEVVVAAEAPAGVRSQPLAHGGVAYRVRVAGSAVAPAGDAAADAGAGAPVGDVVVTERTMHNGLVSFGWDPTSGEITSLIDVARGREVLRGGEGVQLLLAVDQPNVYDAWDTEAWTRRGGVPVRGVVEATVIDAGPLVARVRIVRRVGEASSLAQTYSLSAGSPLVEIDLDIDWHERERLLSLHVPIDVRARDAACGIQFGEVMRPMHTSTSWDDAKFEVCAPRYVDVSEPGFGVGVLNDGRWGYGLQRGGVTVSLLKGARYPDPDADVGRHRVRLAIMPHGGDRAEVVCAAEAFDLPLRYVPVPDPTDAVDPVGAADAVGTATAQGARDALVSGESFVRVDLDHVAISALKRADDGSGDLIVRLYEACGRRGVASLVVRGGLRRATRCNLYEEPEADGSLEVGDGVAVVALRPFELVTLRLAG